MSLWSSVTKPFKKAASWIGGLGDDIVGKGSLIGRTYRGISQFGEDVGHGVGIHTATTSSMRWQEEEGKRRAAKAAHDAEVAQLALDSLGSVARRRRRGFYSTILTGSPGVGTPQGPSTKTVLGG